MGFSMTDMVKCTHLQIMNRSPRKLQRGAAGLLPSLRPLLSDAKMRGTVGPLASGEEKDSRLWLCASRGSHPFRKYELFPTSMGFPPKRNTFLYCAWLSHAGNLFWDQGMTFAAACPGPQRSLTFYNLSHRHSGITRVHA